MKLIVGLGNPGEKYENTRHNVGFEIIRCVAQQHGMGQARSKFDGLVVEVKIEQESALLLMPQTFMNLSGGSVRRAIDFYKIGREDLLVVCDDFHLTLGSLRFRAQGTDGGQKGLGDIIQKLATSDFSRLRVGIGPVPERWNPADFVLGKFGKSDGPLIEEVIAWAADAVRVWALEGIEKAMNQFNTTGPKKS